MYIKYPHTHAAEKEEGTCSERGCYRLSGSSDSQGQVLHLFCGARILCRQGHWQCLSVSIGAREAYSRVFRY